MESLRYALTLYYAAFGMARRFGCAGRTLK